MDLHISSPTGTCPGVLRAQAAHLQRYPPVTPTVQVDVFSLGVILYQMLFGIRPFGEGISQVRDTYVRKAILQLLPPLRPELPAAG